MANVYLTYSRLDEERVAPVAERLASLGYAVRRRAMLAPGEPGIEAADAVIAVWSHNARNSLRVRAEAAHAADRGALLQMRIDSTPLPAPYREFAVTDMGGDAPEWGALENALSQQVKALSPPTEASKAPPGSASGSPLLLLALAAMFAGLAGALAPAVQGTLTPDQLGYVSLGVMIAAALGALFSLWRLITALRAGS